MEDFERCYRAVQSRDARFDGWFFTAVTSTRIYCRPSCPAKTPKPANVRFYPTAAAAQQAGFRACLRCRPDAAPGSPEWLGRADVAARAVKLILDGTVDRDGVTGLARRLGYSERQLHRVLVAEVGTGAVALARAQRAQTARLLLETTGLPVAEVAFAAGFASVRQFNDTVKEIFARTPTELRLAAGSRRTPPSRGPLGRPPGTTAGVSACTTPALSLRLAHRRPLAAGPLLGFLAARAVPGVESCDGTTFRRSLRLAHGDGTVELTPAEGYIAATFRLSDLRDLTTAVARCRQLCNLDADPVAVDEALGADPLIGGLVRAVPGRRVAGAADGFELAVRAVVGQQVSVEGARTVIGRLVAAAGSRLSHPDGEVTHTFPSAVAVAELAARRPEAFPMPERRRRALAALAEEVAADRLTIDPGADPRRLEEGLMAIPGIGPWTASYVAMRALGDPDAFLPTDLGARRAVEALGQPGDPAHLAALAERWRPWRAYALAHLWSLDGAPTAAATTSTEQRTTGVPTSRRTTSGADPTDIGESAA
ncbi:MAG TPA: AlkA N-terminal domain-containing protein [Acidimicrobiales bacterium]|nr:AlkA N-terminal domain-containing protein [Acidimicrobiales bacterium]